MKNTTRGRLARIGAGTHTNKQALLMTISVHTEKGKNHRNGWNYDSKTKMRQGYETKQDRVAHTIRNKMEMQRGLQELYMLHR